MHNRLVARFAVLALAAGFILPTATQLQSADAHCSKRCHKTCHKSKLTCEASTDGNLKTFHQAVTAAGIRKELAKGGPYTIFAPTDAAFAKMNKGRLDALLKDQKKLRSVLLYHVVSGKVTADQLQQPRALKTLEGEELMTNVKNGSVEVGGGLVTKADVKTCNGLLHEVDDVLTPPGVIF